jgi:purine nucleoside phosphorylase
VVTNLAAGLATSPLSHEETLGQASAAAAKLAQVLRAFCREFVDG